MKRRDGQAPTARPDATADPGAPPPAGSEPASRGELAADLAG